MGCGGSTPALAPTTGPATTVTTTSKPNVFVDRTPEDNMALKVPLAAAAEIGTATSTETTESPCGCTSPSTSDEAAAGLEASAADALSSAHVPELGGCGIQPPSRSDGGLPSQGTAGGDTAGSAHANQPPPHIGGRGTYYEVLGLAPDCSQEEVRKAWLDLCKVCHPDKADRKETVQNATSSWFRGVKLAYEVLSDPVRRQTYDKERVATGTAAEGGSAPPAHSNRGSTSQDHAGRQCSSTLAVVEVQKADDAANDCKEPTAVDEEPRVSSGGAGTASQATSWWQNVFATLGIPACGSPQVARDQPTISSDYGPGGGEEGLPGAEAFEASIPEPVVITNPKIKVKEWQMQLRLESRNVERDIKQIQRDEARLRRKMATQEQRGGAQGSQDLKASLGDSQGAIEKLERIKDVMQAISLDLTGRLVTMRTQQSLLSADILRKMDEVVAIRGHMAELRSDMLEFGGQEAVSAMSLPSLASQSESSTALVAQTGQIAMHEESQTLALTKGREEPTVPLALTHGALALTDAAAAKTGKAGKASPALASEPLALTDGPSQQSPEPDTTLALAMR